MFYESEDFRIKSLDYGWYIEHKLSDGKATVDYGILNKNSSHDKLLGYAICVSYMKGWVKM